MRTRPHKAVEPETCTDRPVVIFDGDDTLWKTQCLYDRAKAQMARLLAGTAPERRALIEEFDRFDAGRAERIGLTPHRFLESMAMFYNERRAAALTESYGDSKKVRELASEVLKAPELFRDTISSLNALHLTCRLFLLTVGNERVQRRKVRQTGLRLFFEKVWIVPEKNEGVLRDLLEAERLRAEECWMVGNSLRNDIVPALANGLITLHLDRGGWRYDSLQTKVENPLYRKVRNLGTAARIVLRHRQSTTPIVHAKSAARENGKRPIMSGLTQE